MVKFPQKDSKKMPDKQKYKKDSFTGKERKVWNRETNSNGLYFNWRPSSNWLGLRLLSAFAEELSLMFDRILNATVWEGFHHWGYTRESWTPPPLSCLILGTPTKQKTIQWNLGLTPHLHFLEGGEFTHWVNKAKNVWLIVGQLPKTLKYWVGVQWGQSYLMGSW